MLRQGCLVGVVVILTLVSFSPGWAREAVHYFSCDECHRTGATLSELGGDNICLRCHHQTSNDITLNPGAPPILDGHTDGRFISKDASNAFGNGSGEPGADQTSHTWATQSDTLAAAGAQAPVQSEHPEFYSRYNTSSGKLTCSRCHNPHDNVTTNPKLLVKGPNSADEMCQACHQPWVRSERGWLTHPIIDDYAASVAANPEKYNASLVNKGNASIRLVDGGVSCTSCHGVHFTDSDSSTIDGPTESLSISDGKLLRGDGPLQTDKSSLCQTCHTHQDHGNESIEKVGCMVCHSGHCYDPDFPNYFVLKKSATTTTYNTVNGLDYSSIDVLDDGLKYTFWNDRVDGTAEGYCEKCHGDAKDISAAEYHVSNAICTDCHKHDNELGGFGANCGACHGNSTTQTTWPDGIIANNVLQDYPWTDDDVGSHDVHVSAIGTRNLTCTACHPGNPPNDHYLDDTTGVQQIEVTRMDTNGDGSADYWRYAEGAAAGAGTPIYFETASGADDTDAYYRTTDNTCSNIDCHGGFDFAWGTAGDCLTCHSLAQGGRAAIIGQFATESHHVQGTILTANHCYQCHWEANGDGTINPDYHGGLFNSGAEIDLVIYGAGTRPSSYTEGTTAVRYLANGTHDEITEINNHCLGCHSDQNSGTTPFSDGKTPQTYAWDGSSVASRYNQAGTTPWGKYTDTGTTFITPKSARSKAYSAHGNAVANEGGFNLTETWPNTRGGTVNVACYDCHNSHGSSVTGTTTSYNSATTSGGLIKETEDGYGGYSVSYKPVAGGAAGTSNLRNAGASLCFDCHMNADGSNARPWGYQATFGASQQIMGYFDTPYLAPGDSGPQLRYPYRQHADYQGGHFEASSPLDSAAMSTIDGICTPCHDPHGVSPTMGADQQYGVPMLKGTWLTSPYMEDVSPPSNASRYSSGSINSAYRIDQNTFGPNINTLVVGITETESQFAGLCLQCHPKENLTDGVTHTWKSKDRIHESVKGWKTANGTVKHKYSCSKCHTPHMGSSLPRLMVTNCLDSNHKGRTEGRPNPTLFGYDDWGFLQGRIPGGGFQTCHNGASANNHNNSDLDHSWNTLTPWYAEAQTLAITTGPTRTTPTFSGSNLWFDVTWRTNILSNSMLDYGSTAAYGTTATNSNWVTNRTLRAQNLTNHETTHYRVRSSTFGSQNVASADQSVYISQPPTVPVLIAEPDNNSCVTSCATTLNWNTSTDPIDNGTIEYYAELSTSPSFTTVLNNSGWTSSTSYNTASLFTNDTYYWRVRTRDAGHTTVDDPPSAWSTTDLFNYTDGTPPVVTLVTPTNNFTTGGYNGFYNMPFGWSSLPPGSYQVEVSTNPSFATVNNSSGWISADTWTPTLTHPSPGTTTYYWRVQGQLSDGTTGAWSTVRTFTIIDYGTSSCPFLFNWDGEKFVFEADLYGAGKLAIKTKFGYLKPNPDDYYLLKNKPVQKNGVYDLRLVEERYEADYLDVLKLYTIDTPRDVQVFAEKPQAGSTAPFAGLANVLHTVASGASVPSSVIHVNTGQDVTGKLAEDDGDHVVLNNDRNLDFTYQTLELDLGDIQLAPQVKIVMDAMSMFPDTPEGVVRSSTFGPRTKLEVQDADDNWGSVSSAIGSLPKAPEFSRPYVFDISNIWISDSRKVRFTFLFKTYVDFIWVDTTEDVPVTITEVPMLTAELGVRGIDHMSSTSELYEYVYDEPTGVTAYLPGNYTRLGDVVPLLDTYDDKFVIYGGGDEIQMTFDPPERPTGELKRQFLVYTKGYYKDVKVDVPHTVEPLPFAGMSNFPYNEAVEHYPDDTDHVQYRADYNTRVVSP